MEQKIKKKSRIILTLTAILFFCAGATFQFKLNSYKKKPQAKLKQQKNNEKELITAWINKNGSRGLQNIYEDDKIATNEKIKLFLKEYVKKDIVSDVLNISDKKKIYIDIETDKHINIEEYNEILNNNEQAYQIFTKLSKTSFFSKNFLFYTSKYSKGFSFKKNEVKNFLTFIFKYTYLKKSYFLEISFSKDQNEMFAMFHEDLKKFLNAIPSYYTKKQRQRVVNLYKAQKIYNIIKRNENGFSYNFLTNNTEH